jgi:serine/threonine-protein phosphatase 2A activator
MSQPARCIFNASDLQKFRESNCRHELLSFVRALGQSSSSSSDKNYCGEISLRTCRSTFAIGYLWGSLNAMEQWVHDIPPITSSRARFGNPAFQTWYQRLRKCSVSVLSHLLRHSLPQNSTSSTGSTTSTYTLEQAISLGYEVASSSGEQLLHRSITTSTNGDDITVTNLIGELQAYLLDSFGHPIRIDYGTGHESNFILFLFCLYKLQCFTSADLQAVALGIFYKYLHVARSLQTTYMLEPAGSHGVWGLDDYYILAFYFGACQLTSTKTKLSLSSNTKTEEADTTDTTFPATTIMPQSIHDTFILEEYADKYMYLGCIQFIKNIKRNVPFFESSPMLNDISHLSSWEKISSGLLRMYEAEVLDKLPVVQHFQFGSIFRATWTPSQTTPSSAPTITPFSLVHKTTTSPDTTNSPTPHVNDVPNNSTTSFHTTTVTRAPWATK